MTLYAAYEDWIIGVASFLDITDTSGGTYNQIPTFIRLAELELDRQLQLRQGIRFATTDIDNDGILTLPDDFNKMKVVTFSEDGFSPDAITPSQYYSHGIAPNNADGRPVYYTIIGNNLQFIPLGAGQEVQIAYYRKAQALSATVPENIYSKYAAELLLAGSVMYGMQHLFEEERLPMWKEKFYNGIIEENRNAQSGELGSSPLVMRKRNQGMRRRR